MTRTLVGVMLLTLSIGYLGAYLADTPRFYISSDDLSELKSRVTTAPEQIATFFVPFMVLFMVAGLLGTRSGYRSIRESTTTAWRILAGAVLITLSIGVLLATVALPSEYFTVKEVFNVKEVVYPPGPTVKMIYEPMSLVRAKTALRVIWILSLLVGIILLLLGRLASQREQRLLKQAMQLLYDDAKIDSTKLATLIGIRPTIVRRKLAKAQKRRLIPPDAEIV